MRNNLERLVQYVRKRKLFIFVSAIKGTIVCSMLLLFIANGSNINIIGNKIPEYPTLTSDYKKEGNNRYAIRTISIPCLSCLF